MQVYKLDFYSQKRLETIQEEIMTKFFQTSITFTLENCE